MFVSIKKYAASVIKLTKTTTFENKYNDDDDGDDNSNNVVHTMVMMKALGTMFPLE